MVGGDASRRKNAPRQLEHVTKRIPATLGHRIAA
jgi:hypothetical protein